MTLLFGVSDCVSVAYIEKQTHFLSQTDLQNLTLNRSFIRGRPAAFVYTLQGNLSVIKYFRLEFVAKLARLNFQPSGQSIDKLYLCWTPYLYINSPWRKYYLDSCFVAGEYEILLFFSVLNWLGLVFRGQRGSLKINKNAEPLHLNEMRTEQCFVFAYFFCFSHLDDIKTWTVLII